MANDNKKNLLRYIRIFVSLILFAIVVYFLDWHSIYTAFYQSNKQLLIFAFSLHLIGIIVSVIRWDILVKAAGINKSFKNLFILYWISLFYNVFLPSSIGGDFVRIYDLSKYSGNLNGSIASVVMDRLLGLIILLLIAVVAVFAGIHLIYSQWLAWLVILFFVGFTFLLGLLLLPDLRKALSVLIPGKLREVIAKKTTQILNTFALYRTNPKVLIVSFLWSVVLQLNVIFYFYLIGNSLNINMHFLYYCIAIPIIQVITLIPISISGLGIREITAIALFMQFTISAEKAFSLSILGFILAVIFNSIGGLLLLKTGLKVDSEPHS